MVKFSEDICNCIIENHGEGLSIKDCADISGVARETIHRWISKGKKAKSGRYRQFYLDMLKARAKFKKHHIQKIAENKSWMASQYLLQVTDPEQFVVAEKQEIEATTKSEVNGSFIDGLNIYDKSSDDLDDVSDVERVLEEVTSDE